MTREVCRMENKENENVRQVRTHRIGTITLGVALVVFGSLFLVHLFLPALKYQMIFHMWPCIFILLGVEILVGTRRSGDGFVYDAGAIVLLMLLTIFAMGMGAIDFGMEWYRLCI